MNAELTLFLHDQRNRELARAAARPGGQRRPRPRSGRRRLPRYRLTWTRTTLAPRGDDRRGHSWVIVISATRAV